MIRVFELDKVVNVGGTIYREPVIKWYEELKRKEKWFLALTSKDCDTPALRVQIVVDKCGNLRQRFLKLHYFTVPQTPFHKLNPFFQIEFNPGRPFSKFR